MEQIYNFIVLDDADDDLSRITSGMSDEKAKKFSEKLFLKYDNIKIMPRLYQRIYYEKKTYTDYRRIVYKKYIIIYKICQNQITILRIVSEKQNYLRSRFLKSL